MNTPVDVHGITSLCNHSYLPLRQALRDRMNPHGMIHEHSEDGPLFQWGERFLQVLWNERRFASVAATLEGQELRVLSPGIWNLEAGPDFREAKLLLDGLPVCGAVEIHRTEADWLHHGHHRDPAYDGVVLHVVWQRPAARAGGDLPPCFVLGDWLERPWQDLLEEIQLDIYPYARRVSPGQCAVKWALTENDQLSQLLQAAGLARFGDKASRLRRLAADKGYDQALYELLFEALGYKANRVPFRQLAEALPLSQLRQLQGARACEAALFGAAGLLPDPTTAPLSRSGRDRARALWDAWWPLGLEALPLEWVRAGMRPYNSPERRLAAGVGLLASCAFSPARWLAAEADAATDGRGLLRLLRSGLDVRSGWESAANFRVDLARPAHLLGTDRIHDILVNVMLPFLVARGQDDGRQEWVDLAVRAYLLIPRLQQNRPLSEVVHRLLVPPSREKEVTGTACAQQGLLAVYRDFCLALHHDCGNCPLQAGLQVEHTPDEDTVTVVCPAPDDASGS